MKNPVTASLLLAALLLAALLPLPLAAQKTVLAPVANRFVVGLAAGESIEDVLAGRGVAIDSIPGADTHLVRATRGRGHLTMQLAGNPKVLYFQQEVAAISPEAEGCPASNGPGPQP